MVESFNAVEVFNGDLVNIIARPNGRCNAYDHVDKTRAHAAAPMRASAALGLQGSAPGEGGDIVTPSPAADLKRAFILES